MKVKLMKQNKNTPVVRVASAALAAFVLFFSFCVPSFAYTDTSVNGVDFTNQPYTNSDYYNSSHYLVWGRSSTNGEQRLYFSTSDNFYVFGYPNSASSYRLAAVALSSVSSAGQSRSSNNGYSGFSVTTHDSINDLYYNGTLPYFYDVVSISSDIPVFSSVSDGLSAVRSWLDGSLGSPAHIAVTLKPGYVGYFDITNLSNVSVSLGTSLFSGAKYPGFSTDQAIGTVSSLPSGSFSLPIAGTSSISWAGSGQKDLIGRYSSFSYSHVYTSAGGSKYLVVVNPLSGSAPVLSALGASGSNRNGNITVLIDQCRGSKIYSLTESLAIGSGTLDTESNGTSVNDGVYDPDTGAWNFTDPATGLPEDPSSLPVGGGNDPIIGGTGGNTINEWLEDIANSIKSFFSGAIGAVTTLVSSGSDFIHSLSGLYAWLPGPVYSVLVSALILVITIGVIKVFI